MSTLKVDTIQNRSGGAVTLTNQIAIKSYFYINPASDTTVSDSFNLTDVTDVDVGRYTGNLTSNMDSANFCQIVGGSNSAAGSTDINQHLEQATDGRNKASNKYAEFMTTNAAGSSFTEAFAADSAIIGDLA